MTEKPILYCIIGKNGCGKDTASKMLERELHIQSISIGDLLRSYCNEQRLQISKELLASIGTLPEFNGKELTKKIINILPKGGIINGIRKSSTLHHLMQNYNCICIRIQCEEILRYKRCLMRSRTGDDLLSLEYFLEKEKRDNIYPYNIDLLESFCDIHIPNNNNKHNFKKKLQLKQYNHLLFKNQFARCIIENQYNEILVLFDYQKGYYTLPGGKLENETPDMTIFRETNEKVGLDCDPVQLEFRKSITGKFGGIDGKGYYFRYKKKVSSIDIINRESNKHSLHRIKQSDFSLPIYKNTFIEDIFIK